MGIEKNPTVTQKPGFYKIKPRTKAIILAVFVTFLWSTSWVLIKIGLQDIPPLTFAGLRYMMAFLLLVPIFWRSIKQKGVELPQPRSILVLAGFGVIVYTITQGMQFLSLAYLPALTVNLVLSFTSVLVALGGNLLLGEKTVSLQWIGLAIYLFGAISYFYPINVPLEHTTGFLAVGICVIANAASTIMGRSINRQKGNSALTVTVFSMGAGAICLLGIGLIFQGINTLTITNWLIIGWLALVNTAFAFTAWNLTLHTLTAMESSMINNSMMVQIPILAVIFLNETLNLRQLIGLILAVIGVVVVQLKRQAAKASSAEHTKPTIV